MAEMEERELLLGSLKGYLVDLADSGVDELCFGAGPVTPPPVAAVSAGPAAAAPAPAANPAAPAEPVQAATSAVSAAPEVSALAADAGPVCRQEGNPQARLLFLMSGAGYAGAAGELLAKIIAAMKFSTDQVCLLSFDGGGDAAAGGRSIAQRLDAIGPEVVVTLGEEATRLILGERGALERVRGQWQEVRGRGVMPTLHPETLLSDEGLKRHVWEDMKLVMRRLAGAS